jgi:hypothetical protein
MPRSETRHYSEEELLMHLLQEETPETGENIAGHVRECGECHAVLREYELVVARILRWGLCDFPAEVWDADRVRLLEQFRRDQSWLERRGLLRTLMHGFESAWSYALENPLPTLGYIVVAFAFASERTITFLKLDRVVPATSEVIEIIRQFF